MSLQGIRQNEHTDETKAPATLTVLNHDSFPGDLKLNSQKAICYASVLYACLCFFFNKNKLKPVENGLHK